MDTDKTNFELYLERRLQDPAFRERFEAADRAWDLALQLADLRRARGLTQAEVAEMLGTRQQVISRLEDPEYAGHSVRMVRRYAEALGARLDIRIVPREGAAAVPAAAERATPNVSLAPCTTSAALSGG